MRRPRIGHSGHEGMGLVMWMMREEDRMGIVLAAGILGFWAAVLGLLAFDLSVLTALAIWAGSGPLGALVAVGASLWNRPAAPAAELSLEHRHHAA